MRHLGRNPLPEYPARLLRPPTGSLREPGPAIPGEVVAEFWVRPDGRVDTATVLIVRSTHPAFAEAVLQVLPRYRFLPATASAASSDEVAEHGGPPCRPGMPGTAVWMPVGQPFNFGPSPLLFRRR